MRGAGPFFSAVERDPVTQERDNCYVVVKDIQKIDFLVNSSRWEMVVAPDLGVHEAIRTKGPEQPDEPVVPQTETVDVDESFDPVAYWKNRHKKYAGDIRSVGHVGLSEEENRNIYEAFNAGLGKVLDKQFPDRRLDIPRVLDVGCGVGLNASAFLEKGFEYHGLDVSEDALAQARDNVPGVSFELFDLAEAPRVHSEGTFDCVFIRTVLIHVTDDGKWKTFLENAVRQLKPGGVLVIIDIFPVEKARPAEHVVQRTFEEYRETLKLLGLDASRSNLLSNCLVASFADSGAEGEDTACSDCGGAVAEPDQIVPKIVFPGVCPICGGNAFEAGPGGRTCDGINPRCANCGSLERHRALDRSFGSLPSGWFKSKRTVQFLLTKDDIIPSFIEVEKINIEPMSHPRNLSIFEQAGQFDWCLLNNVLDCIRDDLDWLEASLKLLNRDGVLFFSVADPLNVFRTEDWNFQDEKKFGRFRKYGQDLFKAKLGNCFADGWSVFSTIECDHITDVYLISYFAVRDPRKIATFESSSMWTKEMSQGRIC